MNLIVKGRIKTIVQGFEHTYQLVSTAWVLAYFLCRFLRPFSEIVFGGFMQYTLYPIGIAILLYQLFFSIKINLTDRILHLAIPGWFLVAGIMRNGGISFDLLVSTCIILVGAFTYMFMIYGTIYIHEQARVEMLNEAKASETTEIVIAPLPHSEYIWQLHSEHAGYRDPIFRAFYGLSPDTTLIFE